MLTTDVIEHRGLGGLCPAGWLAGWGAGGLAHHMTDDDTITDLICSPAFYRTPLYVQCCTAVTTTAPATGTAAAAAAAAAAARAGS